MSYDQKTAPLQYAFPKEEYQEHQNGSARKGDPLEIHELREEAEWKFFKHGLYKSALALIPAVVSIGFAALGIKEYCDGEKLRPLIEGALTVLAPKIVYGNNSYLKAILNQDRDQESSLAEAASLDKLLFMKNEGKPEFDYVIDHKYKWSSGNIPRHHVNRDPDKTNIISETKDETVIEATARDYYWNVKERFKMAGKLHTQKVNYYDTTLEWAKQYEVKPKGLKSEVL